MDIAGGRTRAEVGRDERNTGVEVHCANVYILMRLAINLKIWGALQSLHVDLRTPIALVVL